jgi:hypothetical protein
MLPQKHPRFVHDAKIKGYLMWVIGKDMLNPKKPEEAPGYGP